MIADGTELKGKATVDVDSFMANQDPDDLQQIKENQIGRASCRERVCLYV